MKARAMVAAAAATAIGAIGAPVALAGGGHGPGGGGHGPGGHHGGGGDRPVYLDARAPIAQRVSDLLGRMTLEEKVGQMTQAERAELTPDASPVSTLGLGS